MAQTPHTKTLRVMPTPSPVSTLWRVPEKPDTEVAVGVGVATVCTSLDGERPVNGADRLGIEVGKA